MLLLIVKRLGAIVVILLALTAVLFLLQKASPADPVHTMLGPGASQSAIAAERHTLHLDQPITRAVRPLRRRSAARRPRLRPTGPVGR